MDSRYIKLLLFVTLASTVSTTEDDCTPAPSWEVRTVVHLNTVRTADLDVYKEGYVGVNVNAQADVSGLASAAGDVVKTIGDGASHAANVAATAVKTIEVPAPAVQSSFYFEKNIQPAPRRTVVVEKEIQYKPVVVPPPTTAPVIVHEVPQEVYVRKVYTRRPAHPRRKYVYFNANADVAAPPPPPRVNFFSKLLTVGAAPAPAPVLVEKEVQKEVIVPQQVVPANTVHHNTQYTATATVNKNGQLINDIFNIPVQTLRAVNTLVSNIVGGVSVTKQVNTHTVHAADANANANGNANAYLHAEGHVGH